MSIPLIGPDGREYEIEDPAKLADAIKLGYREVTAEAPRTFGESAKGFTNEAVDTLGATVQGVGQGFTAGLLGAGVGVNQLEGETPEEYKLRSFDASEMRRRKEEHPLASGVGEMAGVVLSPINKIAAPIEGLVGATSVLGRIGAKAASNAAMGSLFMTGDAISDASLGDHDLTAEKLISGAGLGAVLGGAGGLFGAAIGEAASAILPKASKAIGGAKEKLLEIRDLFGMKAAGAMGKDFKAAAYRDNTRELVDLLINKGVMKAGGAVDDVADAAVKLAHETGTLQGELAKKIETAGAVIDGTKVAAEIDTLAAKYLKGNVGDQAVGKRLTAEAEALRARGKLKFTEAEEAKRAFSKHLEYGAEQGPVQEGLKDVRGALNKEIEASAAATGAPEVKDWLRVKKEMGLLSQVREFSVARSEALKANRFLSLSDHLVGGAGAGLGALSGGDEHRLEGAATGLALGLLNKTARQRLPSLIAKAADSIASSPSLSVMAASFAQKMKVAAPMMGRYTAPVSEYLHLAPAMALATHIAHSQTDPQYAAAANAAGFTPGADDQHEASLQKAHGISSLAAVLSKHDDELDRHIEKVIKGERAPHSVSEPMKSQDFGAKRMRAKDGHEAHNKRVGEIRQLASDPNALLDRVTGNVGAMAEMAPGVAASITKTANAAVQFLAQASQQPPKAGPLAPEWVQSDEERHNFARVLETIQDPMSVLKHAAAGTLTGEQMAAFQAVYPTLARQVADKTMMRMAESPKSVPYRARLMLGMLTGADPDGTIGLTASNQAAIHADSQKPSNQAGPDAKGAEKLTIAARTALPGQEREARGSA